MRQTLTNLYWRREGTVREIGAMLEEVARLDSQIEQWNGKLHAAPEEEDNAADISPSVFGGTRETRSLRNKGKGKAVG